nr:hypothetical protein [Streptomyces sp. S1D4-11]QIY92928.1 hypothetical protein HEP87_49530 [Streptomyces sp. S1D4-11]
MLGQLAPALGLRTADLFSIAGIPIPQELTPLDARAGRLAAMAGPVDEVNVGLGELERWKHSAGPDTAELIVELR